MSRSKINQNTASAVIKKLRLEKGLSIRKLAKEIGVSRAAISQWEQGQERLPYYRAIEIAKACGVSESKFDYLVEKYGQTVDYLAESKKLLERLDEKKIKAVHSMLLCLNFHNQTLKRGGL